MSEQEKTEEKIREIEENRKTIRRQKEYHHRQVQKILTHRK
jgi:hypothetical protein